MHKAAADDTRMCVCMLGGRKRPALSGNTKEVEIRHLQGLAGNWCPEKQWHRATVSRERWSAKYQRPQSDPGQKEQVELSQ